MNRDFKPKLSQLNQWLKSGNVGVRVELRGNRLSLVATVNKKQRRFSTGLRANQQGLLQAKKQALKLAADISTGVIDQNIPAEENKTAEDISSGTLTIGDAIELFKKDWNSRYSGVKREVTWRKDYHAVFSRLPSDAILTADFLKERFFN